MNGNWYPWGGTVNGNTPADYIAAWRHVHDVFQQEGATNVTWTWTPNGESVPDTLANQPDQYWPGPQYVDWVGTDSYNWGAGAVGWRTVPQMFTANMDRLAQYGKPIMVAETASVEKGGDKAAWISSLYATVSDDYRDSVGAVIWFDESTGGYDFRTNTTPAAQSAFNAAVAGPGILSAGHVAVS
jgi:beta-mannanase